MGQQNVQAEEVYCTILTVSPRIYAIGEKKPLKKIKLLFPNCISWWADGEDRAIAASLRRGKII